MNRDFKIHQANLKKMRETQHSVMNDESLQEFALLLLAGPYLYQHDEV
jgi:hypothetical protein